MLLTTVTVIGALFYAVFAQLLVPFVFGAGYASGILIARLLCLGWCVYLLTQPINLVDFNFGVVRITWLTNLVVFIIVTVNVWLLPIIGPMQRLQHFYCANSQKSPTNQNRRLLRHWHRRFRGSASQSSTSSERVVSSGSTRY
jgi:hypothetical protein